MRIYDSEVLTICNRDLRLFDYSELDLSGCSLITQLILFQEHGTRLRRLLTSVSGTSSGSTLMSVRSFLPNFRSPDSRLDQAKQFSVPCPDFCRYSVGNRIPQSETVIRYRNRYRIHLQAAWGGGVLLSPEHRYKLSGELCEL